jgi:hypothetical protein
VGGKSVAQGGTGFQVTDENTVNLGMYWRDLPPDSTNPIRIWRPHDRFYHMADSPLRSGLGVMRELELINRKIVAEYLSRVASAGVLIVPSEVSFPVREEFTDAEDPFAMEFVELAAEAIKTPGTAAAVVPLVLRVPAEMAAAIKHVDFTMKLDEKVIERRDQAIRRLATKLDIPSDVMLGLGDSNHWCKPDTTRIFTRQGWRLHTELSVGDDVLTLDHVTGASEWQPVLSVYRAPVVDEPMLRIKASGHESLSTFAHRWPVVRGGVRSWTTSAEILAESREGLRGTALLGVDGLVSLADCALEEVYYTGTVWCPTTPNGTWLAEDNGHVFFTGNSAWAVEESGLKVHVAPLAELVCSALTQGYLHPMLKEMGEDPAKYCVWYDMSELTLRPDRALNAQAAYDRLELSSKAYRRETGFSEDDAPTMDELRDIGLKTLIHTTHGAAPAAFDVLISKDLLVPATQGPGAVSGQQVPVPEPGQAPAPDRSPNADPAAGPPKAGPPGAGAQPPAAGPGAKAAPAGPPAQASAEHRAQQAATQHAVLFRLDGSWDLRHPEVCASNAFSCPFTTAVTFDAPQAVPGLPGTYLCSMDTGTFGQQRLRIDGQDPFLDTSGMVSTVLRPHRVNGQAHV